MFILSKEQVKNEHGEYAHVHFAQTKNKNELDSANRRVPHEHSESNAKLQPSSTL